MKHGIVGKLAQSRDTCTSCAGTMILEFAALSRLTGVSVYEVSSSQQLETNIKVKTVPLFGLVKQ